MYSLYLLLVIITITAAAAVVEFNPSGMEIYAKKREKSGFCVIFICFSGQIEIILSKCRSLFCDASERLFPHSVTILRGIKRMKKTVQKKEIEKIAIPLTDFFVPLVCTLNCYQARFLCPPTKQEEASKVTKRWGEKTEKCE